eukprot:2860288-Rhodomonas_salina.1
MSARVLLAVLSLALLTPSWTSDHISLRIVSPHEGQRVRSGEPVRVIVRTEIVGDDGGTSGDISAMTLRLQLDSEEAQSMPAAEKIWGDFAGMADGLHDVSAELASESNELLASARVNFEVGPPRPSVKVTQPLNGSFVNDDPITALFFHEDFDVQQGGGVRVELDG